MTIIKRFALIPAAGVGARVGANTPKQYLKLAGKPMLQYVLETFGNCNLIDHTYVVVNREDPHIDELMEKMSTLGGRITVIRNGGATRHASVLKGLQAITEIAAPEDWVLVHDAARPGLTCSMITQLVTEIGDDQIGGLLALPVVDTLKRSGYDQRSEATVPRSGLWAAQTPQMFRLGLLRRALEQVDQVTDESSAIEAIGLHPKLVEGNPRNFKVTLPQDVALAELFLKDFS